MNPPKPPSQASKPGFVFGLLLGLVIGALITVLSGVLVLRLMIPPEMWSAMGERAGALRAASDLNMLAHALENYRRDYGAYPASGQGLRPIIEHGRGKYIGPVELPKDPWERDYIYQSPGKGGAAYEIVTYGRDGKPGGTGMDTDRSIGPLVDHHAG